MNDSHKVRYKTISETEIEPVLELIRGGDPEVIARKAGITKEKLFQLRDDLLAEAERKKAEETDLNFEKVGRNDPCPCGSGKKYKHCCLDSHQAAKREKSDVEIESIRAREREQKTLIDQIEKTFQHYTDGRYAEANRKALNLLKTYPNEDRLHDILANSYLSEGKCDRAIDICKKRLEIARSEKDYFIAHGRYRDAEIDQPALSYYYPPMTWLQKYWIALKTQTYLSRYPKKEDPEIIGLIKVLQTADDPAKFPAKQAEGLEIRKNEFQDTLSRFEAIGPNVIPYLLPLACKYSWTGILAVEILGCFKTDQTIRALIDISMFGFSYASGASLHYLEQYGEMVIPHIEKAFSQDEEFDAIKTGIVSVLGNVRNSDSYALLLRLLDHQSPHIVNWAGAAIGKFNDVRALPAMMAANKRIGGEKMIDEAIQRLKDL